MHDTEEELPNGMTITKVGRGHYLVKSESREGVSHTVDIEANQVGEQAPLGSCSCEDFLYNRLPKWKNEPQARDRYRCRHLRAVRSYSLDLILLFYKTQK